MKSYALLRARDSYNNSESTAITVDGREKNESGKIDSSGMSGSPLGG